VDRNDLCLHVVRDDVLRRAPAARVAVRAGLFLATKQYSVFALPFVPLLLDVPAGGATRSAS
jgi:hypothetical protein